MNDLIEPLITEVTECRNQLEKDGGYISHEFIWYCEEALSLARKYGLEQILDETDPERTLDFYWEQTQEERDIERYVKEMSAWL